jgi:hypothetical protein
MSPRIDAKTAALLSRLLVDCNPVVHPENRKIAVIDLPTAQDAEYFFRVWFDAGGERQITAQLVRRRSVDTYFWYRPLEMGEFNGSEDNLVIKFCQELEALLTHETRIVQRKGWLFWHFRCEYRGHSVFRGGRFKVPQIEGRKRVYHSAPIVSVNRYIARLLILRG